MADIKSEKNPNPEKGKGKFKSFFSFLEEKEKSKGKEKFTQIKDLKNVYVIGFADIEKLNELKIKKETTEGIISLLKGINEQLSSIKVDEKTFGILYYLSKISEFIIETSKMSSIDKATKKLESVLLSITKVLNQFINEFLSIINTFDRKKISQSSNILRNIGYLFNVDIINTFKLLSTVDIKKTLNAKIVIKTLSSILEELLKSTHKYAIEKDKNLDYIANVTGSITDLISSISSIDTKTLLKAEIFEIVTASIINSMIKWIRILYEASNIDPEIIGKIFPMIRNMLDILDRINLVHLIKSKVFSVVISTISPKILEVFYLFEKIKSSNKDIFVVFSVINELLNLLDKFTLKTIIKTVWFNLTTSNILKSLKNWELLLSSKKDINVNLFKNLSSIILDILKLLDHITLASYLKSKIFGTVLTNVSEAIYKLSRKFEKFKDIKKENILSIISIVKTIFKDTIDSITLNTLIKSNIFKSIISSLINYIDELLNYLQKKSNINITKQLKILDIIKQSLDIIQTIKTQKIKPLFGLSGTSKKGQKIVDEFVSFTDGIMNFLKKYNIADLTRTEVKMKLIHSTIILVLGTLTKIFRTMMIFTGATVAFLLVITTFSMGSILKLAAIFGTLLVVMRIIAVNVALTFRMNMFARSMLLLSTAIAILGLALERFKPQYLLILAGIMGVMVGALALLKFVTIGRGSHRTLGEFLMFVGIGIMTMAIGIHFLNFQGLLILTGVLGIILAFIFGLKIVAGPAGGLFLGKFGRDFGLMFVGIGLGFLAMAAGLQNFTLEKVLIFGLVLGIIMLFILFTSKMGGLSLGGPAKTYLALGLMLVAIGIGLVFMGLALKIFTMEDAFKFALIMGVLALSVFLISKSPLSFLAMLGLAAFVIALGIGFTLIGISLKLFTMDSAKIFAIVMGIIVGIAAAAMLAGPMSILGVGALIGIGIGMIVIGIGLYKIAEGTKAMIEAAQGDVKKLSVLSDIIDAINKAVSKMSLWNALKIPTLKSIGEGLSAVASGIKSFWDIISQLPEKAFSKTGNEWSTESLPGRLKIIIDVITDVFGRMGASGNKNQSLMGVLIGTDLRPSDVKVGINSILNINEALTSLVEGLRAFWSYISTLPDEVFKKVGNKWHEKSLPFRLQEILTAITEVFSVIGTSGNQGFSFAKLILGSDLKPSDVKVGINSILNINEALKSLTEGLKTFWTYIGSLPEEVFKKEGDRWSPNSLPFRLKEILGAITEVFSTIGASGNQGFSILKLVLGSDLKPSDVRVGINSILNINEALTSLVEGLKAFWNYIGSLPEEVFKKEGDRWSPSSLPFRLKEILTALAEIFATIGASGNQGFSILKLIVGSDVKPSDVKVGINSILDINKAMTSIVEGLKSFWEFMNKIPQEYFEIQDGKFSERSLIHKITVIISSLQAAFSSIGKERTPSYFEGIFGFTWGKTDIEKGISSFKDLSEVMKGIVETIKIYADIEKNYQIDINKVRENLVKILTSFGESFVEMYKKTDADWDVIEKGIDSFKNLHNILLGISSSVKSFGELKNLGIKEDDFNVEKPGSIAYNIMSIITSLSNVFIDIAKRIKEEEQVDIFGKISNIISERPTMVKKAIESFTGVGDILMGIAKAVDLFSKMRYYDEKEKKYVEIKIDEITKNISSFITSLADVFINVSKNNTDKIKEAVDSFQNIGSIFNSLNELLKTNINITKEKIDVNALTNTISSIITFQFKLVKAVSGAGFTKESMELFGYDLYSGISSPAEFTNIAIFNINSIKKIVENTKTLIDSINSISVQKVNDFDLKPIFANLDAVINKFKKEYSGYNTLAVYFTNLSSLNPSISKFLENYKIYNNLIRNYVDSINNLKLENINKIIESEKLIKEILMSDKNWIKEILTLLNEIIYNVGNLSSETYDKLKEILEKLKEALLTPIEQTTNMLNTTSSDTNNQSTQSAPVAQTPPVQSMSSYYREEISKTVTVRDLDRIISLLTGIQTLLDSKER